MISLREIRSSLRLAISRLHSGQMRDGGGSLWLYGQLLRTFRLFLAPCGWRSLADFLSISDESITASWRPNSRGYARNCDAVLTVRSRWRIFQSVFMNNTMAKKRGGRRDGTR